MNESKHTAIPWKLSTMTTTQDVLIEGDSCTLARIPDAQGHEESEANAAFIVEACNNYDALKARNAELEKALKVIGIALRDGDGGSYWEARKYLDDRGVYNGDLNDLRVLDAVVKSALAKKAPA